MSRDDLHFRLRIPPDLKERVQAAAEQNRRSMTAEIVHRLQTTFEMDDYQPVENVHPDDESLGAVRGSGKAQLDPELKAMIDQVYEALVGKARKPK